jgi:hypothetical protein
MREQALIGTVKENAPPAVAGRGVILFRILELIFR